MKRKLAQPITIDELHLTLEAMAKAKTPRLDGVVTEIFPQHVVNHRKGIH
jgi:hypothetical protein